MRKKGFTLIELLIVVAIIAILAAIALPNFLEAQVRSKVSRVMSDMRTIGVALESYRLENTQYPGAYNQNYTGYACSLGWLHVIWARAGTGDNRPAGFYLTTPIAYLAAIPVDPFTSRYLAKASLATGSWAGVIMESSCFYGMRYNASFDLQINNRTYNDVGFLLDSVGPDLYLTFGITNFTEGYGDPGVVCAYVYTLYDPTNGTVSDGEIIYGGKGIGFPGK